MLAPKKQRAALEWDDHLTGSLRIPELGNCSLVCVAVHDPDKANQRQMPVRKSVAVRSLVLRHPRHPQGSHGYDLG